MWSSRSPIRESWDWCRDAGELRYDSASRTLLAINYDRAQIVEFDLNGHLVRSFGSRGHGPDELENPRSFRFDDTTLVVLDPSNLRLMRFSRHSAAVLQRVPIRVPYDDFLLLGKDRALLLPHGLTGGASDEDSLLFDVISFAAGAVAGRIGTPPRSRESCVYCLLDRTPAGEVAVLESRLPRLSVFDARGCFLREVDFRGVAVLDRWRREEARLLGNRPGAGKFWVSSFAADSLSSVLLPAHAGTNPLALWKLFTLDGPTRTVFEADLAENGLRDAARG